MKKFTPKEVWIVAAKRTPFGAMNGAFKDITATDLAVIASKAAIVQSGVSKDEFAHVFVGNVQQTSADASYIARHVGLKAGLPIESPALTVNRLCGSGFQAIISAAEQICLGDAKAVLAVGTENMSQAPHIVRGLRQGLKYGKSPLMEDSLSLGLVDSYCNTPMGMTAENLAVSHKVTRKDADTFALESQNRWAKAHREGRFQEEIVPVELDTPKGKKVVLQDEHPRPETTLEALEKLPSVFKKDGTVTAGNASGICDGAGALVLVEAEWGKERGVKPLARLVQWGVAGVEPTTMGIGPVSAIQYALKRGGLELKDIDYFDINEAFASQWLSVARDLNLPFERSNICGGAIALGHPLGASGARITANLIYQLRNDHKPLGVGAACIGGGQGIAVILEAL